MSRRIVCFLLCFALTALTGCGQNAASTSLSDGEGSFGVTGSLVDSAVPEAQVIAAAGSFTMPYNASYGWDPYSCTSMENQAVMELIYEGLFTLNQSFEAENVLCKEYSVSDDGLDYTFTLQEAYFSDGNQVDAEDVYYSFTKAQSSTLYASRFTDITSYEITSMDTIVVHLSTPNDQLPCLLNFPIIPNLSASSSPLGSGPFVRSDTTLTKNQSWWQGAEKVQISSVSLYASASAEDTRDSFEIDMVQLVYNDPQSSTAAEFHCDYELWNSNSTVMQYIGFNMTAGICTDSDIRAGIIRAIDRELIAESVYHNFADATALPVAAASAMYDEDLAANYEYDANDALELLLGSMNFALPEDSEILADRNDDTSEADQDSAAEDTADTDADTDVDADEETDADADADADEETNKETDAETDTDANEETDEETTADTAERTYNNLTMVVLSGNLSRSSAAKAAADCLEAVGFTVEIKTLDEDEFYYTLNAGEYDLFYADIRLTPDFDLRELLLSGGALNYGFIPQDDTLETLFDSAMENSGNRYDLYKYIMNQGYICPVLFENNAVFTTRGTFSGLNPAPGNLFYQIENIQVN